MNDSMSRRSLLRMAGGALCAAPAATLFAQQPQEEIVHAAPAAAPAHVAAAHASLFPKPETPEAAVRLLLEGNERYAAGHLSLFKIDMAELRRESEPHQSPFAAVLTCADSRVPPELIFDQNLGCLFVVRVAGNVASPDTIASLEYAAGPLGVKTILVLGHTGCGAVKATIERKQVPGEISALFQYIRPAVASYLDPNQISRNNALLQANTLRESSPVMYDLTQAGKLSVRSAIYDVGTGKVSMLG